MIRKVLRFIIFSLVTTLVVMAGYGLRLFQIGKPLSHTETSWSSFLYTTGYFLGVTFFAYLISRSFVRGPKREKKVKAAKTTEQQPSDPEKTITPEVSGIEEEKNSLHTVIEQSESRKKEKQNKQKK